MIFYKMIVSSHDKVDTYENTIILKGDCENIDFFKSICDYGKNVNCIETRDNLLNKYPDLNIENLDEKLYMITGGYNRTIDTVAFVFCNKPVMRKTKEMKNEIQ